MTSQTTIDELIEDFAFLDSWEDRYKHVIELGKALPPLDPAERSGETKVQGCVSQVWMVTEVASSDGASPVLTFRGESDAHIVQGLIAILLTLFSGKTAKQILEIDPQDVLGRLGLNDALTPQRSNGLYAMVDRIRADATRADAAGAKAGV